MDDIRLDRHILDSLMPDLVGHDRRPSAYLVYLFLWSRTHADGEKAIDIALADVAEGTGLGKRTVQESISWLCRRKLLTVTRKRSTDVGTFAIHTPWVRQRGR